MYREKKKEKRVQEKGGEKREEKIWNGRKREKVVREGTKRRRKLSEKRRNEDKKENEYNLTKGV